jgi:hypothetical protein
VSLKSLLDSDRWVNVAGGNECEDAVDVLPVEGDRWEREERKMNEVFSDFVVNSRIILLVPVDRRRIVERSWTGGN